MRESSRPPVVVIGAGASGLTSIKCCLEEELDVVCYEKTADIGGLWHFREDVIDGVASVMRSTVINSSKEMSCYSDFPPPAQFANFMHHGQLAKYFDLYAGEFDLRRHVRHHHEVVSVVPTADHKLTGYWDVVVKDLKTGEMKQVTALGVMVCSGHHSYPHIPEFPDLSKFKGKVIHSHVYKDFKGFENLRVVVVGIGNSGGDIAVELSRIASKVYLSTRRGTWIINRVGFRGLPTDYIHLRRFLFGSNSFIPRKLVDYVAKILHNQRFDHNLYNLEPDHEFFSQHPMVNDALPNCILCGVVTVKSDIHHFTPGGVAFQDEEDEEYEVDAVILATGYNIRFPFLDAKILSADANHVRLYKYVFPPELVHPTLAVIGLIQPLGSIVPISEMQARWAVRVFNRKVQLPDRQSVEAEITRTEKETGERFVHSQRHTVQVDYMDYMDDVGELIGARPQLRRLFFTDFVLFLHCMLGANVPYQYRINGPHTWSGARDAIMKTKERVVAPLQTRQRAPRRAPVRKITFSKTGAKGLFAFIAMTFGILMVVLCFALV